MRFLRIFGTPVRVRFAPSPTGPLHLGGLRTALFNYLLARNTGGSFLLRIEDTDRARFLPDSVESIISCLTWAGLDYDEGPNKNSSYGPFFQSARTELYREHALKLLKEGFAYRCFCTPERLKEVREVAHKAGTSIAYDRYCLSLSSATIQENIAQGLSYTVRLKTPEGRIKFQDLVYGTIEIADKSIDDTIILKSDGLPTYHLANVVDDHFMKISHVLRGEEWLSSTPKHIIMYKAFGWDPPHFAHLPLLLNKDKSKLSKRSGDVSVERFMEKGYLPEGLLNFIALLGWSPDYEKEIYTLQELISEFSLDHIGKSGMIVMTPKLDSLNKQHMIIRGKSSRGLNELVGILKPLVVAKFGQALSNTNEGYKLGNEYLTTVLRTMLDRIRKLNDIPELCGYYFLDPNYKSTESLQFRSEIDEDTLRIVAEAAASRISILSPEEYHLDALKLLISNITKETGLQQKQVMITLRYVLTGVKVGAGVPETMKTLGQNKSLQRLKLFSVDSSVNKSL
ncbi:hypothetical protein G9A89_016719 [Geosiphon pyriformis]|nr:hypothetical protein G9A89_016719 [Geosiphon pyriformis]